MQKIGNKEFDSANPRAYKRASRRGDLNLLPAGVRASGRFLTSWIERRDAWAAVRASDACWTPGANASNYVVAAAKQRQPLRVCVWDPNVVRSTRSARTEKNGRG